MLFYCYVPTKNAAIIAAFIKCFKSLLYNIPHFVTTQQLIKVGRFFYFGFFYLHVQHVFVRGANGLVKNTKRAWQVVRLARVIKNAGEYLCFKNVGFIVYP